MQQAMSENISYGAYGTFFPIYRANMGIYGKLCIFIYIYIYKIFKPLQKASISIYTTKEELKW